MKLLISGANGLIGQELLPALQNQGHEVITLGRHKAHLLWDDLHGDFPPALLQGLEAIIHLAGENIASKRWTAAHKEKILKSRIETTCFLSRYAARHLPSLSCFISASAIGYYGNRGNDLLIEESGPGQGFLAHVCCEWERAIEPVREEASLRTVQLRLGTVLTARGGALKRLLPPFRWGLGGRLGSGKQYFSWISVEDVVRAILFILKTPSLTGPVNFSSPFPVTNAELTKLLGKALKRPTLFPVPSFMLNLLLGEMGQELLLSSARVYPQKLLQAGFEFKNPELSATLHALLH
jgi:uncharacterized protein